MLAARLAHTFKLDGAEAAAAAAHCTLLDYDYGVLLFEEGVHDDSVAVLLEGSVVVMLGQLDIEELRSPAMIGAAQLLGDARRRYTVKTVAPAQLVVFSRADYEALRENGNQMAWALERSALWTLARHLRHLDMELLKYSEAEPQRYPEPDRSMRKRLAALFGRGWTPSRPAAEALVASGLFEGIDPDELSGLATEAEAQHHEPGQAVFIQGTEATDVYLLVQGKLDALLHASEDRFYRLGQLEPGAMFGMTSVLLEREHMATMVASEDTEVVRIPAEIWRRTAAANSRLGSVVRGAGIRCLSALVDRAHDDIIDRSGRLYLDVHQGLADLYESPDSIPAGRISAGKT